MQHGQHPHRRARLLTRAALIVGAAGFVVGQAAAGEVPSSSRRPTNDPNQKICETVTMVGSRLAKKKICATRAEWAERRKLDREVIDDAQRHAADPCNAVLTHSGPPAC